MARNTGRTPEQRIEELEYMLRQKNTDLAEANRQLDALRNKSRQEGLRGVSLTDSQLLGLTSSQVDITAPKYVEVEIQTNRIGGPVFYVNVMGVNVLRACCIENFKFVVTDRGGSVPLYRCARNGE